MRVGGGGCLMPPNTLPVSVTLAQVADDADSRMGEVHTMTAHIKQNNRPSTGTPSVSRTCAWSQRCWSCLCYRKMQWQQRW